MTITRGAGSPVYGTVCVSQPTATMCAGGDPLECATCALNASTVCIGRYSCWHGNCSRIMPTAMCAEQPATSILRAWQHLSSACTSTMHGLSDP